MRCRQPANGFTEHSIYSLFDLQDMTPHKTHLHLLGRNLLMASLLLVGGQSCIQAQNQPDSLWAENGKCISIDVPQRMNFCGENIDLTRFDRRERMDREILAFTYMHSTSIQMIKKANRYFPVIERLLKENGIPDDFKYLMAIESSLNPLARSGAGAAGLWQLMPATAKELGLEVNNHVDERYHVEKATLAACRYLKKAYARFGSWVNVAASYNAGQGRISKELERQYENDALDLLLVEETSRYVYRILAAKMMFHNPQQFGFYLRKCDLYPPIPFREIKVEKSIEDLPRFAKGRGISYALLRNLNPWIRSSSLPVHGTQEYLLKIPDTEGMHYNPKVTFCHDERWVTDKQKRGH